MSLSELFTKCDQERLVKTHECRDEAKTWESEGDWYAWNFHQGRSAGTIDASFIYDRIRRVAPAIDAMANLLKEIRGFSGNPEQIDAVLKAAGYSDD